MSLPFVQGASWIWSSEGTHGAPAPEAATPSHYQVRMSRRRFTVADTTTARLVVHVSADSRYLFHCNGTLLGRGPAKGDVNHHFYETYDLGPHLRRGANVLTALVLDMSRVAHRPAWLGAPCSVMTYAGGWLLEGALLADGAAAADLSTGAPGWKVAVDRAHRFQNEGTQFEGYQGYFEHRVSAEGPRGWTEPEFDDGRWAEATVLFKAERHENRRDPTSPYGLVPRIIPALEEAEPAGVEFGDAFGRGGGAALRPPFHVGAGESFEVILDVGELTTAFPRLEIEGGAGATVRLTYAEALRLPWNTPGAKLLGRQQPLANLASHYADESTGWTFDRRGAIAGWSDRWEPAGEGTAERPEVFEPLHWRTFRYVGLRIETRGAPLTVRAVTHRFTAYPYRVAAEFRCSDPTLEKIWRVALRTMRLCAHETFEDCPYYEQMQYAGDTMITSKIAMLATGDYRLTRQALLHFDWSRLPEGLTQSRFPSRLVQVIPSWSLHWITCIRDYLLCSGDAETVRQLRPGIAAVLDWFRRHGDADGLPARLPFWNITDWCPWWPRGVVPGADVGPTAIISGQYVVALAEAADVLEWSLAGETGREAERLRRSAGEWRAEAERLRAVVRTRFWSEAEGLFFDRPGGPEISQYGNAWAVLCGAAGENERRRLLGRFPADGKLAPGSFFWWHAGFRALERCGAYERMPEFLGPWHEMVEHGLSTFVEENSYWRSLCHAWSAHPAIEFMTCVLGVTPAAPGFGAIDVQPRRCGLGSAAGKVCTPHGEVAVSWQVQGNVFSLAVAAPAGVPVRITLPDGARHEFPGGRWTGECTVEARG